MIAALATIPADWTENGDVDKLLFDGGLRECSDGVRYVSIANEAIPVDCRESISSVQNAHGEVTHVFVGQQALEDLQISTWIKWGLIGLYAALMSALMWQDKRRLLAIPGAVAAIAIAATWLSGSSGVFAELMGVALLPFMLSFPIAAAMYLFRPSPS
jgi:CHASE2 domain-containing sensor protein